MISSVPTWFRARSTTRLMREMRKDRRGEGSIQNLTAAL